MPAITDKGVTFVIMPLISLIQDNMNFVTNLNIPACSLSNAHNLKADGSRMGRYYQEIRESAYKLVYITPEKLVNSPGLLDCIDDLNK